MTKDIFNYITEQENVFALPISINGWDWSMKDHIKTSFYYKHGRLLNGNDEDTPVKNIVRRMLTLQYTAEDVDVKDIDLYVDDPESFHLSFLVKKYHDDVFVRENDIDNFLDDLKESKVDYGAGLAKKVEGVCPEVVDLQSIAFCDQTDLMKGPIGIKHFYNPDELKEMEKKGWGNKKNGATVAIDELILSSETYKVQDKFTGQPNQTQGSYIEVYEIHGVLPKSFLDDSDDDDKFVRQFQIVAFYKGASDKKVGVCLFRAEEKENSFKLVLRDKVFGRTLGYGGVEELFEAQVWTNYDVIRIKDMLDAASKTILKSVGGEFKKRFPNGLKNLDNLEVIELNQGEDLGQIDTTPRSMALFERSLIDWENHAQRTASATDAMLGEKADRAEPFRSQERQVIQGKTLHDYRKGKYAKDIEWIYTNWLIPSIVDKITQGSRFLSQLSVDEMRFVADKVATKYANDKMIEMKLMDEEPTEEIKQQLLQEYKQAFHKKGNKHFIEILKGEFKKQPLKVKVNVVGKQKNLGLMVDKLTNIFRQIFANPQGFQQTMAIPGMEDVFNGILEYSGFSPVNFQGLSQPPSPQGIPSQIQPSELLANNQ